ncbi:MAG TPA: DUF2269 family protein [Thermoleophilaceae bacterium]|nr:DUF2269 family protein [Thermoleophilaceae bacterium]
MYELWLAIHIVCAVIWVGGGVSVHVLARMYAKSGDPVAQMDFNRRAVAIGNRLYAPLAIVLIVAGVLLVEEVGYDYGSLWIALGFLGWIVSVAVGIGFYPRERKRINAAAGTGDAEAAGALAGMRRVLFVHSIEILILLLVVVDMAVKPR